MSDEAKVTNAWVRRMEGDLDTVTSNLGQLATTVKTEQAELVKTKQGLVAVQQEVDATNETVRVLAGAVDDLLKQEAEDKKPPFCWLTVTDADEAAKAYARLEKFMVTVIGHHPDGILNDCWKRHPLVVEQLLVLEELFTVSYSAEAKKAPGMRADFWERWLPGAMKRIKEMLGNCSLTNDVHNVMEKYVPPVQPEMDEWGDFDTSWMRSHGRSMPFPPSASALSDSKRRNEDNGRKNWDSD